MGWVSASVATADARDSTAARGTGTDGGFAPTWAKRERGPTPLREPASALALCSYDRTASISLTAPAIAARFSSVPTFE